MAPLIGSRALTGAVGGLRFGTGLSFEFRPSIGILAAQVDMLAMALGDFREPLTRAIEQVMIPSFRQNFASGGRPPWIPLAEYTVRVRGGDDKILVRSGALESDATSLDIWHITDTAASIQSWPARTWYGSIHQAGYGGVTSSTTSAVAGSGVGAAKVHIPARPFIMFQEQDIEDVREVFMIWLTEKAMAFGRLR